MVTRGPRPVVYVCIGSSSDPEKPGAFVSREIRAFTQIEAASLFLETTKLKATKIHGPYRLKREQVLNNTRSMRFATKSYKAIYNDWEVMAFELHEPEAHAYIVFEKRVDGQKKPQPQGTIIVPISDLRTQNE